MNEDELAALAVALQAVLCPSTALRSAQDGTIVSRWKIAARQPDLEMEDLRALH